VTEGPDISTAQDQIPSPDETEPAIAAFRQQLEGQTSIPASVVRDSLLDLWGVLPEGDRRTQVERWLTETLERNLYGTAEVDTRLASVLGAD
jgi:hypothetical protein